LEEIPSTGSGDLKTTRLRSRNDGFGEVGGDRTSGENNFTTGNLFGINTCSMRNLVDTEEDHAGDKPAD